MRGYTEKKKCIVFWEGLHPPSTLIITCGSRWQIGNDGVDEYSLKFPSGAT